MTNGLFDVGLFVASAAISGVVTRVSIAQALRRNLLDHPNERSSHSQPVPRVGGIGIALGFLLPLLAMVKTEHWGAILLGMTAMAGVGLLDDFRNLAASRKYVLQLAIVALLMGSGMVVREFTVPYAGTIALGWLAVPLTLVWLTGFPNFFNFMDGINGMAGGTGVVYGGFLAASAYLEGRSGLVAAGLLLAGSSLGFLFHNFPRAKTFMGDTGSLFLGLGSAMLVVLLRQNVVAALILCSVFVYDSVTTILRRLAQRENIFQAHRSHHYQRLVRGGWTHAQVTFLYLGMHVAAGVLGLVYLRGSEATQLGAVAADVAMLAGLSVLVKIAEIARNRTESREIAKAKAQGV